MNDHKPTKGFEPFSSLYESDEITIYSTSATIEAIGQILSSARRPLRVTDLVYTRYYENFMFNGVHESRARVAIFCNITHAYSRLGPYFITVMANIVFFKVFTV